MDSTYVEYRVKNKRLTVAKTDQGFIFKIRDNKGDIPCVKHSNPKLNYRITQIHLTEETINAMYGAMIKLKEK